MNDVFHAASIEIGVDARVAFAYLADGIRQGEWTLGSWNRERAGERLYRGTSLVDGRETLVRISPDPERLAVDYEVGPSADALVPRISARVVPGSSLRRDEGSCVVTLMVWRTGDQDDESWQRTCDLHRAEIHLIKGRLERPR